MNTEGAKCRRVEFGKATGEGGIEKVGDFCFDVDRTHIYIWIPGMKGPDAIRIERVDSGRERVWTWDGDEEKPTLTPSIHAPGQWHGYLTRGELISC